MTVWTFDQVLEWECMDLPMHRLCKDWDGQPLDQPARFALAQDPESLWLVTAHAQAPRPCPTAANGEFHEGLWLHDVAELFVAGADGEGYLEFNLSPAGAWWAAAFSRPRQHRPLGTRPAARTHVATDAAGGWRAALQIPLAYLGSQIAWGDGARANVTMILGSPRQQFISAFDLGSGEPDFHRPQCFSHVDFQDPPGR